MDNQLIEKCVRKRAQRDFYVNTALAFGVLLLGSVIFFWLEHPKLETTTLLVIASLLACIVLLITSFGYRSDARQLRRVAYRWIPTPDNLDEYSIQNIVNQIDLCS